ncbi:MAG TPA: response regulator transcription factor [Mycobacteriales bacterium]|nr:response regulator transcription factor [Mycobacteriales bacterium]
MLSCRVLVLDERRLLAAGVAHVLETRAQVREVRVAQDLSSLPAALANGWEVVVTSGALAEQVLHHVHADKRVLVIVTVPDVPQMARLLSLGAAGICTSHDLPEDVADAVLQLAQGEMRLPAALLPDILRELNQLRQGAQEAERVLAQLTERERDVLTALGQGRGRAEIGRDLGLSPNTVRTHVQHLLRKLSLHSQQEAGAYARELEAATTPRQRQPPQGTVVIDLTRHKARSGPSRPGGA